MHKILSAKWLWIALAIIIIDQLTKYFLIINVPYNSFIFIAPFFNLTNAHNPGAAFSFLAAEHGWQSLMFAAIAVIVSSIIIYWLYKLPKDRVWLTIALAAILGGAIGNLIDRVLHGFVIDFLDFHLGIYHWPAFNVADSMIVTGTIMLIIDLAIKKGR